MNVFAFLHADNPQDQAMATKTKTHKERLSVIEADLGKLISDIIRSKKSGKAGQTIERGMLVGQLTAAESIIAVVREDMPE